MLEKLKLHKILRHKIWLLPLLAVFLLAPFTPFLDLQIAHFFYTKEPGIEQFSNHALFDFFYVYALVPGQALAILASLAFILSYCFSRFRALRTPSLYLILTLSIGAGLITHAILKDHWGRPRPKQVIEFGGKQPFRPFWEPNFFHQPEPSKSFPCGHCSMGFYFFSLVFLGRRFQKKWLTLTGFILAIFLGISLGITRMAQGGHFFSDVLFSALIMWLIAIACDWLLFEE